MRTWMGLAVLACGVLLSKTAAAQACEVGRVVVDGGYCCWPGQTFDVASNRCAGPPSCPPGFAGSGAECVLSPAPAPSASPAIEARAGTHSGRGWDPEHDDTRSDDRRTASGRGWSPEDPRAAIAPTHTEHHVRVGLVAGGAALFFPAYLAAVFSHYALESNDYYGVAPLWPLSFIPVLHNLAMIDSFPGSTATAMWIIGFAAGAMEIAGLVMLIIGQRGTAEVVSLEAAGIELRLLASAPQSHAGASFQLRF